jgi:hypothetical protein
LSAVVAALFAASPAAGQDSQYWTEEFGNRARLLGGAVVGNAVDMSATFYNPGGLAMVDKPEILLAGTVLQYERFTLKRPQGLQVDFVSSRFGSVPSLFAGEIGHKPEKRDRFAYSFLTRQPFEFRTSSRLSLTPGDVGLPGNLTLLSGDFRTDQNLSEYWVGGTWARRMSDRYAIGATPFIAVRNHRFRSQELVEGLADTAAFVFDRASDFTYQHWRLLAKIGIAWDLDPWRLGAALTTPSVGIWGSGDVSYDRVFVSQVNPGGPPPPEVTSNTQEGLDADFQSPLSIALGASRALGNTKVHLTTEWFNSVKQTKVLEPEDFLSQPAGEVVDLNVNYEMKAVFNGAIGVEHGFREGFTGYGSFRTDFSGNVPASTTTFSTWDIYHVTGGAQIATGSASFTFGGIVSFGSSSDLRRRNLTNQALTFGDLGGLELKYTRFRGIVGFNFAF